MKEEIINSVYDSNPQEYNLKLAEALKKIEGFEKPDWVDFVKSSSAKERPINDPDFWYKRAASILRNLYMKKIIGVNRLRTKYGSKKNRGFKPERFKRASGKIIRTIFQQADLVGFTEIYKGDGKFKRKKSGRILTKKGKEFLESIKIGDKK
jgi:small subunit ribosomal protein S19e